MSDLIDRQAAIDALYGITTYKNSIPIVSAVFNIKKLPSAQPTAELELLDDGTLIVTSSKYKDVKRVLVEDGKIFGTMYYPEEES